MEKASRTKVLMSPFEKVLLLHERVVIDVVDNPTKFQGTATSRTLPN